MKNGSSLPVTLGTCLVGAWLLVGVAGCSSGRSADAGVSGAASSVAGAAGKSDNNGGEPSAGAPAGGAMTLGGSGGAVSQGGASAGGAPVGGQGGAGAAAGDGGAGIPSWGSDADYPYVLTNYDEPYRNQVHFSAPMGWLNDANGMWFERGLYHLSYQAFPYSLEGDAKHWGHATSPDLIHWTHWPIMLDPGVNVPGDVWSGSTVVDVDNTSGLRTGTNPVFVTLYTATKSGTSLAYSNDRGLTWQAYAKNPVAIGGTNETTRDPHVFWYEPNKEWVCAEFEDGVQFYTSPDLEKWTKQSHLDFGFECPDIYELPIDGVAANSKWVVQDAGGNYLLGKFDGKTFTPDSMTSHKMDQSGDFYASQTFNRRSQPDSRVIQMAWLRGMDHATAPWNQALTFPVEVKLTTFPEGVRVARSPVAEIESLYTSTKQFEMQDVAAGSNVFSALKEKVFDWTVVVDLSKTQAKSLQIKIANLTFALDLAGKQAFGGAFAAIDGRVTLRILRDWGQYSVYVNGGEVAFTKAFTFTPSDGSVSLTGDGVVRLSSTFHPLARAWPGKAAQSSVVVEDGDASNAYTGAWTSSTEGRYFGNSCHVASGSGSSLQITFQGTGIEWYGLKNVDLGKATVSIDGVVVQTGIDCYSAKRQNALLFSKRGLKSGTHTIKVASSGQKNAASSGIALVHDYFITYVE